jgi:outer membrane lipoprotein-sorting protein
MPNPGNHRKPVSRRAFIGSAAGAAAVLSLAKPGFAFAQEEDVNTILSAASKRLADVETLHFTLEIEGDTFIDQSGTLKLEWAEGDLSRPDMASVEFKVSLFGAGTVSIRMITVGEDSWTTDLITGNWGDAPPEFGYNPSILYDNQNGLGPVMGKLENASLDGTDEVNDREAHHIKGTASADTIKPLTSGTMTGDNVELEIWIDTETSDLLRVKVFEPESDEKENPATWELNLSHFNEKVTIEPPV